ncbi:MAG: RDD family protein [Candidatus Izemoplasmatales bacterium]|jgi:hypothetical protein|nr:RDD family protein [Candidatus Izemoplasmatales bacterium]HPE00025.1 RDD family protein [Bacillota bacterium]
MRAGFFRRLLSSLLDMVIVFGVIYLSFILFGRGMLQSQIDNYDEINTTYQEIMAVYNEDIKDLQVEYEAAKVLAGEDEDLKAEALADYVEKSDILYRQNQVDTAPYIQPLGIYFTNTVYYYAFIFLIIITFYTIALKGMTLGRRVMRLKLTGPVNIMSLFLHDVAFKYLLIIVLIPINPLYAIMAIMFMFLIDTALIAATRNKLTVRDMISKITVDKTEYNY